MDTDALLSCKNPIPVRRFLPLIPTSSNSTPSLSSICSTGQFALSTPARVCPLNPGRFTPVILLPPTRPERKHETTPGSPTRTKQQTREGVRHYPPRRPDPIRGPTADPPGTIARTSELSMTPTRSSSQTCSRQPDRTHVNQCRTYSPMRLAAAPCS